MAETAMYVFRAAFGIVLAAMLLAFVRFIKGPTSADRMVALDAMTISGISAIAFIAFFAGRIIYLDVALVYALLSFLGVIVIARYIEGGL